MQPAVCINTMCACFNRCSGQVNPEDMATEHRPTLDYLSDITLTKLDGSDLDFKVYIVLPVDSCTDSLLKVCMLSLLGIIKNIVAATPLLLSLFEEKLFISLFLCL